MQSRVGFIRKMRGQLETPVNYHFVLSDHEIVLNQYLLKKIQFEFTGKMTCIECDRPIKKSFQQGYCFPCLQELQACNLCMIYPDKCLVEKNNCDSSHWAHSHCAQDHIVYLANSSGLKVGITRQTNIPGRWIDQGAKQAIPIYKTKNRYQAGLIENVLKNYTADKTNWRSLLKQEAQDLDLLNEYQRLMKLAEKEITIALKQSNVGGCERITEPKIFEIKYPIHEYPTKINSLSLDKDPVISGTLLGIKGQYLILDGGVINIRKFGGYEVSFSI